MTKWPISILIVPNNTDITNSDTNINVNISTLIVPNNTNINININNTNINIHNNITNCNIFNIDIKSQRTGGKERWAQRDKDMEEEKDESGRNEGKAGEREIVCTALCPVPCATWIPSRNGGRSKPNTDTRLLRYSTLQHVTARSGQTLHVTLCDWVTPKTESSTLIERLAVWLFLLSFSDRFCFLKLAGLYRIHVFTENKRLLLITSITDCYCQSSQSTVCTTTAASVAYCFS